MDEKKVEATGRKDKLVGLLLFAAIGAYLILSVAVLIGHSKIIGILMLAAIPIWMTVWFSKLPQDQKEKLRKTIESEEQSTAQKIIKAAVLLVAAYFAYAFIISFF